MVEGSFEGGGGWGQDFLEVPVNGFVIIDDEDSAVSGDDNRWRWRWGRHGSVWLGGRWILVGLLGVGLGPREVGWTSGMADDALPSRRASSGVSASEGCG